MMLWTTTAEARLDERKATGCALGSPNNPTISLQTGVVALNFVESGYNRMVSTADGRRGAATARATSGVGFARHPDNGPELRNIPSGLQWLRVAIERLFVHLQVGIRLTNSAPNIL